MAERFPETGLPGYWETLAENCDQWANEVTVSRFWKEAETCLPKWRTGFRAKFKGDLLTGLSLPKFVGKEAKRIEEKISARCGSDPAEIEALFPKGCDAIPRLNDLVRTRVSCRFVESVEYFADRLVELATEQGLDPARSREGRIQGYFAQHVTFRYPLTYRIGGTHRSVEVMVEIQVATEMSTRVWEATHAIYEDARRGKDDPAEWQWNPRDPRFVSRQLGHTIHLADGLLSQLRDHVGAGRTREDKGGNDD